VSNRLRALAPVLVPSLLALAIIIAWAASGGGYLSPAGSEATYEPDSWFLGALAIVGLLLATLAGLGPARIRVSRTTGLALAAFGAYVVFSYASILWAGVPGDALDGANRTLAFFAIFALFAVLPWRTRAAELALAAFAIAGGLVALVTAARLGTAGHPSSGFYLDGRLASPLSYQNANAAFFTMVALAGVGVGSRRRVPVVARVLALTAAGLGLQLAVLAQSRGWLFTLPVVLLAALVLVPGRVRLVLFALAPVLATAAIAGPLLDVFRAAGYHGTVRSPAVLDALLAGRGSAATSSILLADLVLLVVAAVAVMLDSRRPEPAPATVRTVNRVAAGVAIVAVLGGSIAGVVAAHGDVGGRIDRAWRSFKHQEAAGAGANRFTQLGSGRYDFWRVSLNVFAENPVGGIGSDNFAEAYTKRRRTGEETRTTHSLEMRLLAQTGIVGTALFLAFLGAAFRGALRGRGRRGRSEGAATPEDPRLRARRDQAALALLPATVWLIHGSLDWFWEFPALSGAALAFLGTGLALGSRPRRRENPKPRDPRLSRALVAVGGLIGVVALVVIAFSYLGERDLAAGLSVAKQDPAAALGDFESAASREPLSAQPDLLAGTLTLRQPAEAQPHLEEATSRNPDSWATNFFLGLLASARGNRIEAESRLRRAHELIPSDPIVAEALARATSARPMTVEQALSALRERTRRRFGP
jgi:hypothetical protein